MWDVIPSKLIAKYQAASEDPLTIYRELKRKTVDDPEKMSHDIVIDLLQRYRQALPENELGMIQVKQYYADRIEEMRQMSTKVDYDRAKLLLMVSTCLSHSDQVTADNYLTLHKSSPAMTEYANRKIHNKVDQMFKNSNLGKKPEDSILPTNPTGKIGRALHQLAVQGKMLPKAWTKQTPLPPKFQKKGNRNSPYKKNKPTDSRNFRYQNSPKPTNHKNNQGRGGYKNQGGRALQFAKQSNESKRESKPEIVPKYDVTKIPSKLKHFASKDSTTTNLKQLLVDQCETENLIIDLD